MCKKYIASVSKIGKAMKLNCIKQVSEQGKVENEIFDRLGKDE